MNSFLLHVWQRFCCFHQLIRILFTLSSLNFFKENVSALIMLTLMKMFSVGKEKSFVKTKAHHEFITAKSFLAYTKKCQMIYILDNTTLQIKECVDYQNIITKLGFVISLKITVEGAILIFLRILSFFCFFKEIFVLQCNLSRLFQSFFKI